MEHSDTDILYVLRNDPDRALRMLYGAYYKYVCAVVYKMIGDSGTAEDIAQEVFVEVWKRRDQLDVTASLKGYLRRTAVNKTLNHIRSKKMDFEEEEVMQHVPSAGASSQAQLEVMDLQEVINKTIEGLPEKCRIIFGMSRFEELSYREISEKLEISIKTVENQMSKALKVMRRSVANIELERNI